MRSEVLDRLDARARDLGETEKWEALKKARGLQHSMENLLATKDGIEFFNKFRDVSPEQRAALEREGVDLRDLRRLEPLADALRQDSHAKLLLSLLRTNPLFAIALIFRYFWLPIAMAFIGIVVVLWQGNRMIGMICLVAAVVYAVRIASK